MLRAVALTLLLVLAGCQTPGAPAQGPAPADGDGPADPATDRLGWENGYWHNESLSITPEDGLNASEREQVVARAMARVELVRQLEFEESVPVRVINRSTFANQSGGGASNASFQRFDNAKFEALFLVGEANDSVSTQDETRTAGVAGYYSPGRDSIVIVSDSATPRLTSERTLAHELVHALQDQHFDLGNRSAETRDAYQGQNGLIEGDATLTQRRYMERCGTQWDCISAEFTGGGDNTGAERHPGIFYLMYFPYGAGPNFVEARFERGGWEAVNAAYDDIPAGSPAIIYPDRYGSYEPASVRLPDRSDETWSRVSPPGRPDHAVLGQSAIAAGIAYTVIDDVNDSAVAQPGDVFNYEADGSLDRASPFNYGVAGADGWEGGRMYVYERGAESGYVWRTEWTDAEAAATFVTVWGKVIQHWGGTEVADGVYTIEDGEFADSFALRQHGATVTIVNGPTRASLDRIHSPANAGG
jgi:hypothetical protein